MSQCLDEELVVAIGGALSAGGSAGGHVQSG
jgi:hypothetical protein